MTELSSRTSSKKRLFVALELPDPIRRGLIGIQPAQGRGVRPVAAENLHLTLAFLGDQESEPVVEALRVVEARPFELSLLGVGHFRTPSGAVLWAGVETSEALVRLQDSVCVALESIGLPREKRPYHPHLTLARCRSEAPKSVIRGFLATHADFEGGAFGVESFTLFSSDFSEPTRRGPTYDRLAVFPLT